MDVIKILSEKDFKGSIIHQQWPTCIQIHSIETQVEAEQKKRKEGWWALSTGPLYISPHPLLNLSSKANRQSDLRPSFDLPWMRAPKSLKWTIAAGEARAQHDIAIQPTDWSHEHTRVIVKIPTYYSCFERTELRALLSKFKWRK